MTDLPSFSIVIPTRGRPESLGACLRALSALEYPADRFEVIVVEDGPSGNALKPKTLKPHFDALNLRHIQQDHAGPAAARNRGAAAAGNSYLAFTDDDCRPDPGWLRALARQFDQTPGAMAGGRTENGVDGNSYSEASQLLVGYIYEHFLREDRPFFASNNLSIARKSFHRLGGFSNHFQMAAGEDRDFCDSCLHQGVELVYVPKAVIRHHHSLSAREFLRQHFNYGRGAYIHHRTRASRGAGRIRLESLRFYLDLLRYPYTTDCEGHSAFVSSLMFLSQIANAAGFFLEKLCRFRSGTTAISNGGVTSSQQASRGP